jgi:1,4-dihydroxy-2-naphthoate octaprenyltransferase
LSGFSLSGMLIIIIILNPIQDNEKDKKNTRSNIVKYLPAARHGLDLLIDIQPPV